MSIADDRLSPHHGTLSHLCVQFEGRPLSFYTFRGHICVIAAEVGRALGYADDGKGLVDVINKHWADEMIAGRDFDVLRHGKLSEFRCLAGAADERSVAEKVTQLTILYESGYDLVCIKTEKPHGKELRRLLADVVLPKLRRGEPLVPPTVDIKPTGADSALLRERRLMARELRLSAHQKAEALRGWARRVREHHLAGDEVALAYENEAASIEVGRSLLESRPVLETKLYTATEIGEPLGLTSKAVGIIAREIGIFENKEFGQHKMSKGQSNDGLYSHWVYNERGKAAIEAEAEARAGRLQ